MILYMTYSATISSKGQVTIPIEARRKLKLRKEVTFDIRGNELVMKPKPTKEDIWAVLDAPSKQSPLSDREALLAETFTEKDKQKRGY